MSRVTYDLHIHSCLSPCGDNDMTPANIVGMAAVKELDVIAVTDHNSCKNCEAVCKWANEYGVVALPGMELTTKEEVHVLCLFSELQNAVAFDSYVYEQLHKCKNNASLFGNQIIYDQEEKIVGEEQALLIQSTDIAFDQVFELMKQYDGVMIPAHIDKASNSLLYHLGFIPEESQFKTVEVASVEQKKELIQRHPYLSDCLMIHDSDAHYLGDIHEPVYELEVMEKSAKEIIKVLRNELEG